MAMSPERMTLRTLGELLGTLAGEHAGIAISGLQIDSRRVTPGDLFIAVPGETHDGRQFMEQAVANGAVAVLAEAPVEGFVDALTVPLLAYPDLALDVGDLAAQFYGDPSRELELIGITGTNGKTTVSRLIAQISRQLDSACGVIGTLGVTLGDDLNEAINTTPDALSLQRQFARWRDAQVPRVAMEVSSHALAQGRVTGARFDTAVFTNLSHDHLDYHGSMENYGRAKLQLFRQAGLRRAVVNIDDAFGREIVAALDPEVAVFTYAVQDSAADLYVRDLRYSANGVSGLLVSPWGEGKLNSPLPGAFNAANLLSAIGALVSGGADLAQVLDVVPRLVGVPGRMQRIDGADFTVIVDYAHTPDALEHALNALRPHVAGRLCVVFGCGGDRDAQKRPVMGRIASELADVVVLTSDNPRGEAPAAILEDIARGCSGDYSAIEDRGAAIYHAIATATTGDCVLIAGKGHEDYQIIGTERLYFSDAERAAAAVAAGGAP